MNAKCAPEQKQDICHSLCLTARQIFVETFSLEICEKMATVNARHEAVKRLSAV